MARMILLEDAKDNTTYAEIDRDEFMTIRKRYLNYRGQVYSEYNVVLSPEAQKVLYKLLSQICNEEEMMKIGRERRR